MLKVGEEAAFVIKSGSKVIFHCPKLREEALAKYLNFFMLIDVSNLLKVLNELRLSF
jgi:hypothetical protein